MRLSLTCQGYEVYASLDQGGSVTFHCPYCGELTFLKSEHYRLSKEKNEIRTLGPLFCGNDGCKVSFELVHGCFIETEPPIRDYWSELKSYDANLIYRVWRARHVRGKRNERFKHQGR